MNYIMELIDDEISSLKYTLTKISMRLSEVYTSIKAKEQNEYDMITSRDIIGNILADKDENSYVYDFFNNEYKRLDKQIVKNNAELNQLYDELHKQEQLKSNIISKINELYSEKSKVSNGTYNPHSEVVYANNV